LPARLLVQRHSNARKLQLQPLLTLHRPHFSRLQILAQNPTRLWWDLGEFLRFGDLANAICLLSLFAAEEAADEEVEAGEIGCDDEDYAHCDAGFGAGEDGLVLNRDFEAKRRLNDQEAPEHLSLVGEASPYIP
jgi:hypothetical protein